MEEANQETDSNEAGTAPRRRWIRRLAWTLLAVAVVRAALPWAIEGIAERVGAGLFGRNVTLADVDLEVLAGRAHLRELVVGEPLPPDGGATSGSGPAVVSIDRVSADFEWLRLLTLDLVLARVELERPRLRINSDPAGWPIPLVLRDHRPRWARSWIDRLEPWVRRFRAPFHADALHVSEFESRLETRRGPVRGSVAARFASLAGEGMSFEAGRIDARSVSLAGGQIEAEIVGLGSDEGEPSPPSYPTVGLLRELLAVDGDRIAELSVRDTTFQAMRQGESLEIVANARFRDVAFAPAHPIAVQADLSLGGGVLRVEGELTPSPPSYDGRAQWESLDLAALATVADLALPVDLEKGASDGDMHAQLAADLEKAEATFQLSGHVELHEIHARGETDSFDARIPAARVQAERLAGSVVWSTNTLGPIQADLELVEIDRPTARMDLPVLNLAQIDVSNWIPDDLEELLAQAEITIAELRVTDGSVDARDSSVTPGMQTELTDVDVELTALRWPELDAEKLRVSTQEAKGGAFDLAGSVRAGVGNMSGLVSRMPLAGFSGYAVEISGFQIVEGNTSLDSSVSLAEENATLQGNLTLHRLDIEAEEGLFANVFGPPLEVGLMLLSDENGNIVVPVVLEYEYGTELSLWQIAWGSLKAAMQGGIGSALGGVAGPDGAIEPIPFPPGLASTDADERLAKIARALERHPSLTIGLVGHTGPSDREARPDQSAEARRALAAQRAQSILTRLTQTHGVPPDRVTARAGEPSEPSVTLELSVGP